MTGHPDNAVALYYVAQGYSTAGRELMGIQAAQQGLLGGFARHGGMAEFSALVDSGTEGEAFRRAVQEAAPTQRSFWIHRGQAPRLASIGTLLLPGPGLHDFAWARHRAGDRGWSLVGITHTTATARVQDALALYATVPVQPWDALICTSRAVQAMVRSVLDDQDAWLRERLGATPAPRPELPVLPLGIDHASFAAAPHARTAWRERLELAGADVAVLHLGRLSPTTKAHPVPLFQAMQRAATSMKGPRLVLVLAGWFATDALASAYAEAARAFCPDVRVVFLDGRRPEVRTGVWQAADIFVSPVDNIQETFGLAPLEAMAAGLPVVVSDWDGYRDTVRDGIDGYRVPTIAAGPGVHADLPGQYADGLLGYDAYVGALSRASVVDVPALAAAIVRLAGDPALRRQMGAAARAHAAEFDWQNVIPRYQALFRELATIRHAGPPISPGQLPARPDPGRAFAAWPSATLDAGARLSRTPRPATELAALLAASVMGAVVTGTFLPARRDLERLLARVDGARAGDLFAALGPGRQDEARRLLLFLAKFDFIAIAAPHSPASKDPA